MALVIWSCDVEEESVSRGRSLTELNSLDRGSMWEFRGWPVIFVVNGDELGKPPDDVDVGDDPTLSTSGLDGG